MSVSDRIHASYNELTESEKRIAKYFLKHGDEMISYSSKQMAELCHTSAPTIVRFARTLGYKGLSDLKVDLIVHRKNEVPDLTKELEQDEHPVDLIKAVYSHRLGNLKRTEEMVDPRIVNETVDLLEKAHNIFLFGIGASGNVCYDLYQKLNRIGYHAVYTPDTHVQIASLSGVQEGDAVIAISYSGETDSVLESVRIAKELGAHIIGISRLGNTSLRSISEYNYFIPHEENMLRVGAIASRDSSLLITDIIYLTLFSRNLENNKKTLEKTREWAGNIK